MIRNTYYVFSHFSNKALINELNQSPKNYLKNLLGTNLWRIRKSHYGSLENSSNIYVERLAEQGIDFHFLTNNDPVLVKRLKLILLEIDNERHSGNPVPETITEKDYWNMLSMEDACDRKVYLTQIVQNDRRKEYVPRKSDETFNLNLIHNHIYYALSRNSLFTYRSMKTSHRMLDIVGGSGIIFGNNIVIDVSYEPVMKSEELLKCVNQIVSVIYHNRSILNPFNIHLCSAQLDGQLMKLLQSILRRNLQDWLINIHTKSYLDIFDRNQLVYLSPDAKDELVEYNPNEIYIIGGLIDREPVHIPHSLEKVKSEKIVARRFPVLEYIDSHRGTQSFGIDTTFKVLGAMNYFKDWRKAFRHLPKNFLRNQRFEKAERKWSNLHLILEGS